MNKAFPSTILITGATGWVGRSFIHELQLLFPATQFLENIYLYASDASSIVSTAYEDPVVIPVHKLSDIVKHSYRKNVTIVHAAFLTKDKIRTRGYVDFVETNCEITSIVVEAVQAAANAKIVHISSGAAQQSEDRDEKSLGEAADPYGYLKLKEERILSTLAITQSYRVYALTGRYITNPQNFAIGDFLLSAYQGNRIHVYAPSPVIRGYVNATTLAKAALSWLFSEDQPQKPVNAVTNIITLKSLATRISVMFHLPDPFIEPFTQPPNSYSSSPASFVKTLTRYRLHGLSIDEQILDTYKSFDLV